MMKIKLTDINDWTNRPYLKQNPEYSSQLVATLNQVDGFSSNQLRFVANSCVNCKLICNTFDNNVNFSKNSNFC